MNGQERRFLIGLARAFGGAIIFVLPMLLTMEMWWLGFYLNRWHLILLMILNIPLLIGLSHYSGFEATFELKEDALDAFVAYAVAFVTASIVLILIGAVNNGMALDEVIGKITIQTIPGSIGALLAQSQFGGSNEVEDSEETETGNHPGYLGTMFLMVIGALVLGLNVAPTEEVILIAFQITKWHAVILAVLSIAAMHAFVYVVRFQGQEPVLEETPTGSTFLRFTIVGYVLVLLVSLYLLWTFERTISTPLDRIVVMGIVLGFPGSIGAAAARLIL